MSDLLSNLKFINCKPIPAGHVGDLIKGPALVTGVVVTDTLHPAGFSVRLSDGTSNWIILGGGHKEHNHEGEYTLNTEVFVPEKWTIYVHMNAGVTGVVTYRHA